MDNAERATPSVSQLLSNFAPYTRMRPRNVPRRGTGRFGMLSLFALTACADSTASSNVTVTVTDNSSSTPTNPKVSANAILNYTFTEDSTASTDINVNNIFDDDGTLTLLVPNGYVDYTDLVLASNSEVLSFTGAPNITGALDVERRYVTLSARDEDANIGFATLTIHIENVNDTPTRNSAEGTSNVLSQATAKGFDNANSVITP